MHDRFRAGETERDAPLIAVVSRRVVAYCRLNVCYVT